MAELVWLVKAEQSFVLDTSDSDENRVVLTRSEFFARLRLRALLQDSRVVLDELAPLVAATKIGIRNFDKSLHLAFRNASALMLLHEGGVWVHDSETLKSLFGRLAEIERELLDNQRFSSRTTLLWALNGLREQHQLPSIFDEVEEVEFDSIVDFSPCELQIIFRLAELGQKFKFRLPFDPKARGLLLPVQALLSHIEAASSSLPIVVELDEVRVAKPLVGFFNAIFEEAAPQDSHNGSVRLAVTSQFVSQVNWVCEQIVAIRKQLNPPCSIALAFRSFDSRFRWFEEGLRRHHLPYKINASLALNELPQAKILLRRVYEKVEKEMIETKSSLSTFLEVSCELVNDENLALLLRYLAKQLHGESQEISMRQFVHWLELLLDSREVGFASSSNADAIELVSVKHLGSKKYDHVFVVDMAQGRFPKVEPGDSAFCNTDRLSINKLFGRPVLPILYDDPLEASPLPTRQAFETLWFVQAIASAQKGLYLSSSTMDPSQREQATSEFLNAAIKVVGPHAVQRAQVQRNMSRLPRSKDEVAAFQIEPAFSKHVFKRWLGLDPAHPLTPTRLEAFASCPFRGLVQNIFGVEDAHESQIQVDARKIGRFVHAVLETFFLSYDPKQTQDEGLGITLRHQIAPIIAAKRALLEDGIDETSRVLIEANLLWLTLVIERAISNHLNEAPVANVMPVLFEHAIGFNTPSFKISIGEHDVFLGGILDRVDEGEDAFVVIDYKMSSAMTLRQKLNPKEILKTHFQLPLYIRLLIETEKKAQTKPVYAYLMSIRDGVTSKILGMDLVPEIEALVTDDSREDGLAFAIKRVMSPLLDGYFPAKRNLSCDFCHLKPVCRVRDDLIDENVDE